MFEVDKSSKSSFSFALTLKLKMINRNKTEVKTGLRSNKNIEIISGLNEGDIIVAEGLKKVRPRGKIKPINK